MGSRKVGPDSPPYVIAEIGVNHEGCMERAKHLIASAKAGGADAAKFQTYKAETLASKNSPAYWDLSEEATRSQYELFQKYDAFGRDEYVQLAEECARVGIDFISTPFDNAAVEFLNPIMDYFKIASADLTNVPFLRLIGSKRKPVVLSTGASTVEEIDLAIDTLNQSGCEDVVLLHCILNYPTPNQNAHLKMIKGLKERYQNHVIGYSDHTLPDDSMTPLVTAYLLGAVVIEKHFTHDKNLPGNDHYHAMDEADLERFIQITKRITDLKGEFSGKQPIESEAISRVNARRSLVLERKVEKGHIIAEADLAYKRPGTGISPLDWDRVIGMRAVNSLDSDHILTWDDVSRTK